MGKCDTCRRRIYGYLCDGCIHDGNNKDLYEPMTNADRIRAMSDEELAIIIMCPYYLDESLCNNGMKCVDCCLDWLKQTAEVP